MRRDKRRGMCPRRHLEMKKGCHVCRVTRGQGTVWPLVSGQWSQVANIQENFPHSSRGLPDPRHASHLMAHLCTRSRCAGDNGQLTSGTNHHSSSHLSWSLVTWTMACQAICRPLEKTNGGFLGVPDLDLSISTYNPPWVSRCLCTAHSST